MISSHINTEISKNNLVVERLTALWALNECGLGGFMHAISSPFTGILVGGISILLITLIAANGKSVWPALLKALTIVLLVKLSVSPHSPVTSYLAVSFQAFMGMLLYSLFKVNKITVLVLGLLTFLESALQKLLTLTIIYGESLWDAVDVYGSWVGQKVSFLDPVLSSRTLIWSYVIFYAIAGIFMGIVILRTMTLMRSVEVMDQEKWMDAHTAIIQQKKSKSPSGKILIFWAIALLVILLPLLFFNSEFYGWKAGLYLVARSALILVCWYLLLGPLLLKGIQKLLSRRRSAYQEDIQNTLSLLPHLRLILKYAWKDSRSLKGMNRFQHFIARSIVYSVYFNPSES
ncbi:hypothetical protein J1N09_07185 [Aureitalea sp. L0-47]|uniref:hypothetical protein n=1 Tax=Aureitalea sp. L0-47 TaxID=2816962 RepID=UPI0022375BC0|nr:hypothetical protein [Aureitalea sp. L0-47]MCW5519615.1 hypothetical protein [Aureitalea sp. L0-47]